MFYQTITYPHERCIFSPSGESINILSIASFLVKEVLCTAQNYISADIAEVFYYKLPPRYKTSAIGNDVYQRASTPTSEVTGDDRGGGNEKEYFDYNEDLSYNRLSRQTAIGKEEARHPNDIEWSTIARFTLRDVAGQIRDYIELWHLMPGVKCTLLQRDEIKILDNKGFRYYVDAIFSNPTPKCPNPLAVAKVTFHINVPELMPKYYPVMVTYRFEGFKSVYYALGAKQMRSLEFQRFFIDTILHMKLKFYAELLDCRFPNEKSLVPAGDESGDECDDGESEEDENRIAEATRVRVKLSKLCN